MEVVAPKQSVCLQSTDCGQSGHLKSGLPTVGQSQHRVHHALPAVHVPRGGDRTEHSLGDQARRLLLPAQAL